MKKTWIILSIVTSTSILYAGYSTLDAIELEMKAEEIRKELNITTPTIEEKRLSKIRAELNLDFDTSSKDALLGNNKANSVQPLTGIKKEENFTESITSSFENLKEKLSFSKKKKKSNRYSFSDSLSEFYDTVGLEEGDSWGMPSVFGINEKSKAPSSGIPIFTDVQSASTTIYKGMKHSGESAELMSGMMYRSSQVYNTMFGLFDDSPFNVFDGNEKKDSSIFDIFD